MQVERASKGMFLVALMLLASLSGCFGEDETIQEGVPIVFQIDYQMPSDVVLKSGEWHEFQLLGSGRAISVPNDVMLFVDGYIIPNGYAMVEGESINGKLLLTPYVDEVKLTIVHPDGTGTVYELDVTNGTPIVNGKEWMEKMEHITSVCPDTTQCGGYINRWMGSPNPAFERAASFFQGHFEGLGYETHILRVFDHGNPAEPESLNVIAWKRGRNASCVQGMGGHMDIMFPGGPPGGGTYEGAYDNTGGTVSMMLFAKAFVDIEVECDTFLALWSSEEEGLRGSNAFANNECDYCLPTDKELRFYINMDMMGISILHESQLVSLILTMLGQDQTSTQMFKTSKLPLSLTTFTGTFWKHQWTFELTEHMVQAVINTGKIMKTSFSMFTRIHLVVLITSLSVILEHRPFSTLALMILITVPIIHPMIRSIT